MSHLPLVYHPNYSCPFPENHRFVMSKFVRLFEHVKSLGLISNNLFEPQPLKYQDYIGVHCPRYLEDLSSNSVESRAWRRVGLPWSQGLADRTFTAPNGTFLTAKLAIENGMACHLAGGTHHAHYDFGSGFCMLNDLAFAATRILDDPELSKSIRKILIFDLDVHQGDGTASILENDDRIFTCSIHCEKNFPFRKSASDLDIGLAPELGDQAYLDQVEITLNHLIDSVEPNLVLYDAGVDVWEQDELGLLNISWNGIESRDELVLETCLRNHIPVATVIGGGYDKDHDRLAKRHGIVVDIASQLFPKFC